jgi:membrane-associated protein
VDLAVGIDIGFDDASAIAIYVIVWSIVFIESGLLFGFFLPGDTLLLAAGIAAKTGRADIYVLVIGVVIAAILGDSTGYALGRRAGRPLLERRDGRVLNQHNLQRATAFYDRFGSFTIVAARFVPWARTFAPLIAGCTLMPYRKFLAWNVMGGVLWGAGIPFLGYLVGEIPGFEAIALGAVAVMVVISFIGPVIHYLQARKKYPVGVVEEQEDLIEEALD